MSDKLDPNLRCYKCRMPLKLCFCKSTPHFDLKTKVVVFMHRREFPLMTNTGVLANRVLTNSQIVFRGHENKSTVQRQDFLDEKSDPYILFPAPNAIELNEDFANNLKRPITLICPDGHWGQAIKMLKHEPSLKEIPCIKLPIGSVSNYRLRRNPIAGRVCTFEAIARAMGILEDISIQQSMENVFDKMVTRNLWLRGLIPKEQVDW